MKLTTQELEEIGITALNKAYQVHEELGVRGKEVVEENRFGERVLRMDFEAEEAVIETLRLAGVPIKIISEEHGITYIGTNPKYLGILDGLDGSRVYTRQGNKDRYATMFGIFSGLDPEYSDYIFSGVMEHSTGSLFFASKDRGSFVISNGKRKPISCSDCEKLDKKGTRIYADEIFDEAFKTTVIRDMYLSKLQGYKISREDSSAIHYTDLASNAVDLVLECTRKGNLEIAVAYGLVTEAGGVIVTQDGTSLKHKRYSGFGQDKHLQVISASTEQLARELVECIT